MNLYLLTKCGTSINWSEISGWATLGVELIAAIAEIAAAIIMVKGNSQQRQSNEQQRKSNIQQQSSNAIQKQQNRAENLRNRTLDHVNKNKLSIQAIERFNDKIEPKFKNIQRLLNNWRKSPSHELAGKIVITSMNIVLSLNSWAVFVLSDVANNAFIIYTLKSILNHYRVGLSCGSKVLDNKRFNLANFYKLMKKFKISLNMGQNLPQ